MTTDARMTIWEQLVAKKADYIGGVLVDLDDDPLGDPMPAGGFSTTITDMDYRPNGQSFYFSVEGKDFGCGGDIAYLAVDGSRCKDGTMALVGYGGHRWTFRAPTVGVSDGE